MYLFRGPGGTVVSLSGSRRTLARYLCVRLIKNGGPLGSQRCSVDKGILLTALVVGAA